MIKRQSGQAILALILIMTVALAIGLSVVQKSLVDVSTSTKVEESSRAFSAAEAGIEHALRGGSITSLPDLGDNNATITSITGGNLIPTIPAANTRQDSLEYPPLAKEEIAHVWLADFTLGTNPPDEFYKQTSLNIYWGDPKATDKAALELTIVSFDGSKYISNKFYLDNSTIAPRGNNFDTNTICPVGGISDVGVNKYQCSKIITGLSPKLMLIRARLLYNSTSQPFAVQATYPCGGTSGNNCFIPPQARILTSTGISGETQRRVQVFRLDKVVPPYFDYAIFSLGAISK